MPEREQYGRIFPLRSRAVEIGRNEVLRQTLEDHFLDDVAGFFNAAGDACVEGAAIIRQPANQLQNFRAYPTLAGFSLIGRLHRPDCGLALVELLLRNLIHPVKKPVFGRQARAQQKNQDGFSHVARILSNMSGISNTARFSMAAA